MDLTLDTWDKMVLEGPIFQQIVEKMRQENEEVAQEWQSDEGWSESPNFYSQYPGNVPDQRPPEPVKVEVITTLEKPVEKPRLEESQEYCKFKPEGTNQSKPTEISDSAVAVALAQTAMNSANTQMRGQTADQATINAITVMDVIQQARMANHSDRYIVTPMFSGNVDDYEIFMQDFEVYLSKVTLDQPITDAQRLRLIEPCLPESLREYYNAEKRTKGGAFTFVKFKTFLDSCFEMIPPIPQDENGNKWNYPKVGK